MSDLRPIPGCPGYFASSDGRIKGPRGWRALWTNHKGYLHFSAWVNGKTRTIRVNVSVCMAFHGPRPEGHHAAHRDGDKLNNSAGNLYWATAQENEADKALHGTRAKGSRHGRAKLSEADVLEIREQLVQGAKGVDLAARYGVSMSSISEIKLGRTWSHI